MNRELIAQSILSVYKPGMVIVIYGQTATGKTKLSLEIAKHLPIEVISADSRQIYRYMDIGTDKVSADIRQRIPHHQIDIIDPDQTYTAWQRQQDTYQIIHDIQQRGNIPVIVWGTWLYIDTIVYNFNMGVAAPDYAARLQMEQEELQSPGVLWTRLMDIDPVEAARHHPSSTRFIIRALEIYQQTGIRKSELMRKQQPKYPLLMVWLWQDVAIGNQLIDKRLGEMLEIGLVDEVRSMLQRWYNQNSNALQTIDYKQTVGYIRGDYTYDTYIELLQIANHQLAKKQRTWFRRYKRDEELQLAIEGKPMVHYLHFYLPDYI